MVSIAGLPTGSSAQTIEDVNKIADPEWLPKTRNLLK